MFGYLGACNGLSSNAPAEQWKEIEVTIDSGACDSVMPIDMCRGIAIRPNALSAIGFEYEVANGQTIPNVGERHCLMMTEGSRMQKRIIFQCADVHKPLLSISRVADMGYECRLGANGGLLVDNHTGETIPLHRRGNLYHMKAWVKDDTTPSTPDGFVRQG